MRIRTDGDKAWRTDEIEAAADVLGRNKTDSVVWACSHLVADREQKEELAAFLAKRISEGELNPKIAAEICDILGNHRNLLFSPSLDVQINAGIQGNDREQIDKTTIEIDG
jgi:hypothetical protein